MAPNAGRDSPKPKGEASGKEFDKESATRKSGRWGANEPPYGEHEPSAKCDSRQPNPQGPEYEEGGAYPGRPYKRSPESMEKPAGLGKRRSHGAGEQPTQERTVGNHPADPNRMGADWNLLPPGISDKDVRDPGGMKEGDGGKEGGKKK